MPPLSLFLVAASAHTLAVMSPGPDLAVVTRQTLAHGRSAGLRTAWGVAAGIAIHVSYALFGLNWALEQLPGLLTVLRVVGMLLLLRIGYGAIQAQPIPENATPSLDERPGAHDFAIGFGTNVLNAKAMMFFIALCAAVVTTQTPIPLKAGLGLWMVLTTGLWFSLVAWSLGHPWVRTRLLRYAHWIDRVMGLILLTLAATLLFSLFQSWLP